MSSKSSAPWISIKLGRALNAINIDVPRCPSISTDIHEKAHVYDAITQSIFTHLDTFNFAKLSGCLTSHVPGKHVFLFHQVQDIHTKLINVPFIVTNLTSVCFLSAKNHLVDLNTALGPVATCPANITYFRVSVQVNPSNYAPSGILLADIKPFIADYNIPLPQIPVRSTNNLPRTNLWPPTTPGNPRPIGQTGLRLGYTIQRFAHSALSTVFAAPTPDPPSPVQTPATSGQRNLAPPLAAPSDSTTYTYAGNLAFPEDQVLFDSTCNPRPKFSAHDANAWTQFCHRVKWTVFKTHLREPKHPQQIRY